MYKYIIIVLLSACTTPNVRDTSRIDDQTAKCETPDCVIDIMDKLPQGRQEDRFPFMEGYPDTNLRKMKNDGKLSVTTLNPLFLILGVYGYSYIVPYDYGKIKTCEVQYLPGLNWLSLKHELSHCQGYADHGIPIMVADYTDEQKFIMEKEKVSRWIDTSYYINLKLYK